MITVEHMELNEGDQNVGVRASKLIKAIPGIMSDFKIIFATSDKEEENKNFILNIIEPYTPFPDDLKILGVVGDNWGEQYVIVYS